MNPYVTIVLPDQLEVLVVGHLRWPGMHPPHRARVPLFDELTPQMAADSPWPLYALASLDPGPYARCTWRLLPADHIDGDPARVCLDTSYAAIPTGQHAEISETVYAAMHLPASEHVPTRVAVYHRP